jgi:predicted amidohydrolase
MSSIEAVAVQLWSDLKRTPEDNREHALEMAEIAAKSRPDLLVLPEAIAMLCYPDGHADFSYRDVSEAVPGPSTARLTELARTYHTNIVVGLIADHGPDRPCQNVAVVIDRHGEIVGQYEKVHEPEVCRLKQDAGVGSEIPVFDLDIGRIGIMVCWDLISPEVASILAYKGAKLICFPHMIALPSPANFGIQLRARAIDTGLPIIAAGMRDAHNHSGSQDGIFPTCIISSDGQVLAQSALDAADIVRAEVDLDSTSSNRDLVKRSRADLRFDVYAKEYDRLAAGDSKANS